MPPGSKVIGFLLTGLWLSCLSAGGQLFTTPLYVGTGEAIEDEFADVLDGNNPSPGDLVHLYFAVNGVILPPATDGTPHPDNLLVPGGVTRIGSLAPAEPSRPGVFNLAISGDDRPQDGQVLFVRVFNAGTLAEATFYGNSQLFTVDGNTCFDVMLGETDQPLDPTDADGDGVNQSYEESLGTLDSETDSDGDGHTDLEELIADTDGTNPDSHFLLAHLNPVPPGDLDLVWHSVLNKRYRVEQCADTSGELYVPISQDIYAQGTKTVYRVLGGLNNPDMVYRVRVFKE